MVLEATQPEPLATQLPPKQQPEPLQVLPGQQGSVGPPQLLHSPAAVELVAEQMPPALQRLGLAVVAGQHGSPKPPQVVQKPLLQRRFALQVALVPQQGCPTLPQPEHTPAEHTPPELPVLPPVPVPQVAFWP